MIAGGARVVRHENDAVSATSIVSMLIRKGQVALQMQEELKRHGGELVATSAGQQLQNDMGDAQRKMLETVAALDTEMRELRGAREQVERDRLQIIEERQQWEEKIEAIETEQERLASKRVS